MVVDKAVTLALLLATMTSSYMHSLRPLPDIRGSFKAVPAIIIAGAFALHPDVSKAQIPMAEDFYQTSGTFVGRHAASVRAPDSFGDRAVNIDYLRKVRNELNALEPLVKSRKFDDVMAKTKVT